MDEEKTPLGEEENQEEPEEFMQEEPEPETSEKPKKEARPEEPAPRKNGCGLWKALTAIFFILLVISVFTNGFRFGSDGITGEASEVETSGEGVTALLLSDSRCKDCDTSNLVSQLDMLFDGELEIIEIDYNDAEGKELYEEAELEYLPAVLFDEQVKTAGEPYKELEMYLIPQGEYLSLRIGADFDPNAEICDNEIDDTGNDLVDCEDPDCEGSLLCRKAKEKELNVFVMSQCPFGTKALDAMEEVLEAFEDDGIKFDVHYIASENEDGTFNSLHGQAEVDENIRQLCVKKYYESGYKYMDYIWCRNPDITSDDWESCAEENGMSVTKIKACAEGDEGKELLAEDIKLAQQLKISASPSWLANNRHQFSGVDAERIKTEFCRYNEDLAGCEETLSADTAVQGSC